MTIPTLTSAIATIAAALVAGGVAFLASVLSKEQKTSEFRQTWIDALREDISKLIGSTEVIIGIIRFKVEAGKTQEAFDYFLDNDSVLRELAGTYYRIRLRLN